MYLSQLILNLRSREARTDLADRYQLHRTLMSAFPERLPPDERILYRVDDQHDAPAVTILVQSRHLPDWEASPRLQSSHYLFDTPRFRSIAVEPLAEGPVMFRLQANPTIKRDGKRHALYAEDILVDWLQRKGNVHGFRVDPIRVQIVKLGKRYGQNRRQTWHAVQFDGHLEITDKAAFVDVLINGIGSAKAFGFGLLSIPYRPA